MEKHDAAAAEPTRSKTASGRPRDSVDDASSPATSLKCQKLANGDKAEAGRAKRMQRASQEYIDILLREKATGTGAYRPSRAMELVDQCTGPDQAELRALVARSEAARERVRAGDADILEQYHRLGYAYCEMEEDDSFVRARPKVCRQVRHVI